MDTTQRNNMLSFSKLLNDNTNVKFLNHGYFPINPRVNTTSLFNTCVSLYINLFEKYLPNLCENSAVLDIGCGRGGGVEALRNIFNIKNLYGCDFNSNNIEFCRKNIEADFSVCDAIDLIYPSNYFDCIVNIESSNCYTDIERFYREVKRVLTPGGIFLYADIFRDINQVESYTKKILNEGFTLIDINDVTYNAYLSCAHICRELDEYIIKNNITSGPYIVLRNLYYNKVEVYKDRSNLFFMLSLKSLI